MTKRKRRWFKNIYFETKTKKRDSVFAAVRDIGRKGVNNAKEVGALAFAQLLDYLDKKTANHYGEKIRFTDTLWRKRTRVLYFLSNKFGGKSYVKLAQKLKQSYDSGKITANEIINKIKNIVRADKLPLIKIKKI